MKNRNLTGKIKNHTTIWICCASAACMMALPATAEEETAAKSGDAEKTGEAAAAAETEEDEEITNWADLTVGGVAIDGNDAAFQRRAGQNGDFYGGIGSGRWEKEIDDMTLLIEGHALFGNEDYDISMRLDKADIGYVKGGFNQFRTWYDGSGGFVPGVPGAWIPLYDDDLSVDRGKVWFEAGLRMEDIPEITFGYSHEWRDGTKDSTIWGQSDLIPIGYGIVPTFYNIDETRDIFTLDLAHTLGKTDLGLGLRYDHVSNENSRVMNNRPGAAIAADDRTVTQTDVYDSDLFGAHIFSETRFNDKMLMSFGYSFTTMDTDTNGSSRTVVDRDGTPGPTLDHAFSTLTGGGQLSMNVANANFWWNPIADLVVVPSFRAEWEDQDAIAFFLDDGGVDQRNSSDSDLDKFTEQIEVRYTGLDNLVLYSSVEATQADGSILYRDINDATRRQTSDISQEKYVLGANWYPRKGLSVATQYYHRDFDEDFDNVFTPDSFGGNSFDAIIKSHASSTDDVNLRVTWRALPNLTLVSRYDYQQSTVENQGIDDAGLPLATVDSADITRNVFSQSATWLPIEQAYVQGTVSYVLAETDTPSEIYAPFRLADSANDYVTATFTVGYALDKKTDLQASYSYYYSNNYAVTYESPGVPGSVPFGSDAEEHLFSLSLNRRISPSMLWNVGYGFYTSNDGASGGYNDFDAHMVSTGLQVRF
jgi:hypothetical protein